MLSETKIQLFVGVVVVSVCLGLNYLTFGTIKIFFEEAHAPTLPPQSTPFYDSITS